MHSAFIWKKMVHNWKISAKPCFINMKILDFDICWGLWIWHLSGVMQGQRGTFGFHEQGESTRLKIYFYVTAIWFHANPTLRDYHAATSTWTCCPCTVGDEVYNSKNNKLCSNVWSLVVMEIQAKQCVFWKICVLKENREAPIVLNMTV